MTPNELAIEFALWIDYNELIFDINLGWQYEFKYHSSEELLSIFKLLNNI